MGAIGQSVKRLEDRPLLLGRGQFAADLSRAGQLHMRVVRSPCAFGRLRGMDIAAAERAPGVVSVWTFEDVKSLPPIDFRMSKVSGLEPYRQTILARDYVRYVGDPVAAVFAEDIYSAEDAADLVACHIEELPPCLNPTDAPRPFMPETAPGLLSEAAVVHKGYGDVAAAFAQAHAVVEIEVSVGRHSGVPMETRGALAWFDAARGVLIMQGAAKVPHFNRDAIARMLELPAGMVQLVEGHVGGGFGVRGELYPEDVLVCQAAMRFGRAVKWIEDRQEHLMATNHSRDQTHRLRAAVDARGFILGLEDEFWADQGGYIRTHGVTVSDLAAALLPGPYVVPAYRVTGHVRLTNKTPAGTYRAPGRYESTFARERLLDAIACRLSLDRIAVRRVNLIGKSSMPFDRGIDTLGTRVLYDSGDYAGMLARLLDYLDHEQLAAALARRREAGEKVGFGLAFFVEKSGLGPSEKAIVSALPHGRIEVVTGAASVGQGMETALAQICADTLGSDIDCIDVVHGQTERIDVGIGAFASRVTTMTGCAVRAAAESLRVQAIDAAAEILRISASELFYEACSVKHRSRGADREDDCALRADEQHHERNREDGCALHADGQRHEQDRRVTTLTLSEIAGRRPAGLSAEGWFHTGHMNYPYGIHAAVVRVDEPTCAVHIERLVVACEVGRAINPMLVHGQITGAAVQGIGGALFEEFVYDEAGQPLATTLADYLVPTLAEVPEVEVLMCEDAPSPQNPLGVKGAGEGGVNAVGAALASAIDDALGQPGLAARLPVTPGRLHRELTARRRGTAVR